MIHPDILALPIPKPVLKWVGGKTQILDKLVVEFPREINNYREAFVGGGSVLLAILSCMKHGVITIHGNIYAHDLNEPLIYVYKNIQRNHHKVYTDIQTLIDEFNACSSEETATDIKGREDKEGREIQEKKTKRKIQVPTSIDTTTTKEMYYYWLRSKYNQLSMDDKKGSMGSAMFIFLNKTCFRGVFRVGPHGFNVPYGHYHNPEIMNAAHLDEIHTLIQPVIFECSDFNASLAHVDPNDFIYLDPPYAPETDTSFVGYTEHGFNLENHTALFARIHSLSQTSTQILMSNSDVPFIRSHFNKPPYTISSISCKRSINSKKPNSKTNEVIIKNY